MKITDEMVHIAACEYSRRPHDSYIADGNIKYMRRALEAAMQVAPDSAPLSEEAVLDLFHRYTVTNHEGMEVTDIYKFASAIGNLLRVNHTT